MYSGVTNLSCSDIATEPDQKWGTSVICGPM